MNHNRQLSNQTERQNRGGDNCEQREAKRWGVISVNSEAKQRGRFLLTWRGNAVGGSIYVNRERPKRGGRSISVRETKTGGAINFCREGRSISMRSKRTGGRSISMRGVISVRGAINLLAKRDKTGRISVNFYSEPLLSFPVISVNFTNKMGTGVLGELEPRGEGNGNSEIVEC